MKIQSAVLPYRFVDNELQILLITSRRTGNWGIPKGHLEALMTPAESAAKEAYEEGGVIGKVSENLIGDYQYEKFGNEYRVDVFLLQVEETLHNWPERISRKRSWEAQKDAVKKVHNKGIRQILESLCPTQCIRFPEQKQSVGPLWQSGSSSICLDFDDTLCQFNGEPIPGAREGIQNCLESGYQLFVSSARFSPIYGELNEHRINKVREWLKNYSFPEIPVLLEVPACDLYIDDKGWAFQYSWPELVTQLSEHFGIRPYRQTNKTLSLSLRCIADVSDRPIPEAGEKMHRLSKMGFKIHICLGLYQSEKPKEERVSNAVAWLKERHLPFHKVSVHKLASDLYISPNALRFDQDWGEFEKEIHKSFVAKADSAPKNFAD